jgi:hypothetical protein
MDFFFLVFWKKNMKRYLYFTKHKSIIMKQDFLKEHVCVSLSHDLCSVFFIVSIKQTKQNQKWKYKHKIDSGNYDKQQLILLP